MNTTGNRKVDLTGRRFGRLTAVSVSGKSKNGHYKWKCDCDCGGSAVCYASNLLRGIATSCGCYKKNLLADATRKHGMRGTRMWKIWTGIRKRCTNPNCEAYKDYGGRGITICDRWSEFINFYDDMKDGYADHLTLDRKNPNGNYEPGNCRWSTVKEQARNRRNSVFIEYKGERRTLAEWAELHDIRPNLIQHRIKAGWDMDRVFLKPKKKEATLDEIRMYLVF